MKAPTADDLRYMTIWDLEKLESDLFAELKRRGDMTKMTPAERGEYAFACANARDCFELYRDEEQKAEWIKNWTERYEATHQAPAL